MVQFQLQFQKAKKLQYRCKDEDKILKTLPLYAAEI